MSAHVRTEPETHQAVCGACGWHTYPVSNKAWAEGMAKLHDETCPAPPPRRSGALMSCGCWWYADPGSSVGQTSESCPLHGQSLMAKANVDEPDGYSNGKFWTHPIPDPVDA